MHKIALILKSIIILITLFSLFSCNPPVPPVCSDAETNSDIVSDPNIRPSTINVDVYLDATTSMSGFAVDNSSTYIKFIEELEAAVTTGIQNSAINYYKFGTRIKQISRNEAVFQTPDFYSEKGIFERTSIDSVLARADAEKSTIILTDLFQSEGDVNQVVDQFKKRCFSKGLDVGIILIPAEFQGKVYDAKVPAYPYSSTKDDISTYRPFYALFIGNAPDFQHLVEALKSTSIKNVISEDKIILLPRQIVTEYSISVDKDKTPQQRQITKRWVKRGFSGKNPFKNIFRVTLSKGEEPVPFVVKLDNISPVKYLPEMQLDKIEIQILKCGGKDKSFSVSEEFQTTGGSTDGAQKTLNMLYKPKFENDTSSYKMLFSVPALMGYNIPGAFSEYSSVNPTSTNDANKTLNLEKFITDLIRAYSSTNTGYIAKGYLYFDFK